MHSTLMSNAQPGVSPADNWQQYAKEGETAQQCIERHRSEQDGLLNLLAQARARPAATQLFLVGQCRGPSWEFQGVFSTPEEADAACKTRAFFVYPIALGEEQPTETTFPPPGSVRWPCCDGGEPLEVFAQGQAAYDVLAERQRQVHAEGWTPEHDDEHDPGELAAAAAAYAMAAADLQHPMSQGDGGWVKGNPPAMWPWAPEWWKPTDAERCLEKAGALLLAALEQAYRTKSKRETGRA